MATVNEVLDKVNSLNNKLSDATSRLDTIAELVSQGKMDQETLNQLNTAVDNANVSTDVLLAKEDQIITASGGTVPEPGTGT